jgi:hypothetical protein
MKMKFSSFHGIEYTSKAIIQKLSVEELKRCQLLIARKCLEIPDKDNHYDHALILDELTKELETRTLGALAGK